MAPKEKAIELFKKMFQVPSINGTCKMFKSEAKQCALIAVDEILFEVSHNIKMDWIPERKDGEEFTVYWQQVKTEIENL